MLLRVVTMQYDTIHYTLKILTGVSLVTLGHTLHNTKNILHCISIKTCQARGLIREFLLEQCMVERICRTVGF